jgi:hypothetical protein
LLACNFDFLFRIPIYFHMLPHLLRGCLNRLFITVWLTHTQPFVFTFVKCLKKTTRVAASVLYLTTMGRLWSTRLCSWLRYYPTRRKDASSIPNEVVGFLIWTNPSSPTMALKSTHAVTEMSTRNLRGGKGRPACKADNHTAICEPIV